MNKFPSNEYGLIRRIQGVLPSIDPLSSPYEMTIGDDAAIRVNWTAGERLIVTADVSVENIHFSLDMMTFEEVGYKAMVSNLSDCAAMGARPDGAVVQIVFPIRYKYERHESVDESIEKIYRGFAQACERWNFPIIGGDISGGNVWTVAITLIGSIPPDSRAVRRTGIVDGDILWATGTPGLSAAGLAALRKWGRGAVPEQYHKLINAHISPIPRIDEGRIFAADPSVHAMMDLSDGLSKDVATLCYDNNLGFNFDDGLSPSPEMITLSNDLGCDWKDWYYHGGEEYELLIACDPSYTPPDGIRLGQFTSKHHSVLVDNKELPLRSWDHCCC